MLAFLSKSIASINSNKVNGMLAEVAFRRRLNELGFGTRVSPGGWIARSIGEGSFGARSLAVFPQIIDTNAEYGDRLFEPVPSGLHAVCSKFHEIGIHAFYAHAIIRVTNDPTSVEWYLRQLGIPEDVEPVHLTSTLTAHLTGRTRPYNFLRYSTSLPELPDSVVSEEFSKENLRVAVQTNFESEISDVDAVFWGSQYAYPVEIKEKTVATDRRLGAYFGLDIGPFVKLAFYAAKRRSLHSLFVVHEITDTVSRQSAGWWCITFDELARFASWTPQSGGRSMTGGSSAVVKIPKARFHALSDETLATL